MTKPIGTDSLSTFQSDTERPHADKSPSSTASPAKATLAPPADLTTEPDLSRAHLLLADTAPVGTRSLDSASAAESALDSLKQSMAAQPEVALAGYRGLSAAQVQVLLTTPTN